MSFQISTAAEVFAALSTSEGLFTGILAVVRSELGRTGENFVTKTAIDNINT